jgi:hypothetical protein
LRLSESGLGRSKYLFSRYVRSVSLMEMLTKHRFLCQNRPNPDRSLPSFSLRSSSLDALLPNHPSSLFFSLAYLHLFRPPYPGPHLLFPFAPLPCPITPLLLHRPYSAQEDRSIWRPSRRWRRGTGRGADAGRMWGQGGMGRLGCEDEPVGTGR